MTGKQVVLVTGAGGYWGSRVAAELLTQPDLHVIGLDEQTPHDTPRGLDFIQADIRNPLLTELLRKEEVRAVCHLAFMDSARPSEAAFDFNVMGTMKVLAACAEAGVSKVVLKSSTMVYGARSDNSAFLREDHPLHGSRAYGYVRDLTEIEAFWNGFRSQAPEMLLTILRFAHIVGPHADSPMTRFLREEEAPALLGFDPMIQIIHEADVVAALVYAMLHDAPGAYNIAAEGAMPLWRLIALADKVTLPVLHPLAYLGASLLGPKYTPLDLDYLRYPCVADLHKMRAELKFVPQYTADETAREFAAERRLSEYVPESAARAYDEERLRDTLDRRARARSRTNGQHPARPPAQAAPGAAAPKARRTRRPAKPKAERAPAAAAEAATGEQHETVPEVNEEAGSNG